jgi:TonB family protein
LLFERGVVVSFAPNVSKAMAINFAPDGQVLKAWIVRPSGDSVLDDAAMRAVQKSDPMPLDNNGTVPGGQARARAIPVAPAP